MRAPETNHDPEQLALRALVWTLAEPERAMRLLDVTGLKPHDLRARASDPVVLAAALGFLEAHEPDLIACAQGLGVNPGAIVDAHAALDREGRGMKGLLICDCDEVLLHMVRHFGVWLRETHDILFSPNGGDFATSMTRRDGSVPSREEMWGLLEGFFPGEMERQTLVPHAREFLAALSAIADVVILTNLGDANRQPRVAQLLGHGMEYRVETNQGGKGDPVARLVAEHGNPVTVFVDDLAVHHDSVARHAPQVHRLHMISEPSLAPHVPKAASAHARIDDWRDAQLWIAERFAAGTPADLSTPQETPA